MKMGSVGSSETSMLNQHTLRNSPGKGRIVDRCFKKINTIMPMCSAHRMMHLSVIRLHYY
jgi:hypothetical protein